MAQRLVIVDYGSQYTFLLARRFRSHRGGGVLCEIVTPDELPKLNSSNCCGVVLSGGPRSVTSITDDERRVIFDYNIPVLGICFGMQLLGHAFGGVVSAGASGEFGPTEVRVIDKTTTLFNGLTVGTVWMSHGDEVKPTNEFMRHAHVTALSVSDIVAAIESSEHRCWGVQFHPEVLHTNNGTEMLRNFAIECCGMQIDGWSDGEQLSRCLSVVSQTVGLDDRIVLGLSGGVDSAVVAALLAKALKPEQWLAVYVDHGMMRLGESDAVRAFADKLGIPFKFVDYSDEFFAQLQGVIDPEQKRKIIGRLFIEAFKKSTLDFAPTMLAQGTIYPDVVESAMAHNASGAPKTSQPSQPSQPSQQHLIKSHHNVGGLPEQLGLRLLEPLRWLFKDEVRSLGAKLGLPDNIVNRPPFPGPGLGIRVIGQPITRDRVQIVQKCDAIFHNALNDADLPQPSQSYAGLLSDKAVGVVGDQRRHGNIVCLRAVTTDDFMTASIYDFNKHHHDPISFLQSVASTIVNQCPQVARVVFDITPKPPGTIELE